MSVDFQIIGGGLIGLSTAYALQKRGARVRVLERRDGVGLETSFANAGMLHASVAAPWNHPGVGRELLSSFFNPASAMKLRFSQLPDMTGWGMKFLAAARPEPHWHATRKNFELAEASMEVSDKWRAELGKDIDACSNGLLNILRTRSEFEKAKASGARLQSLGLQMEILSPDQVVDKEPALAPIKAEITGALYYGDDRSADAYKFCQALADQIKNNGGEVITGTSVSIFVRDNGRVIGLRAEDAVYEAGTTIIAAGAYSAGLLEPLGVNLPLRPVKGYSLTFDGLDNAPIKPTMPVVDESLHAAMTPLGDRLRIAGTAEITGFNTSLPKSRLKPLLGMLKSVYPDFAKDLSVEQGRPWYGFRPVSADGIPFIGRTQIGGLAVNTGHGHMGWTLAAGSGELLADILDGHESELDASAFDPVR